MSAERDNSQKVTFVYSNIYKIYQKGKDKEESPKENQAVINLKDNLKALNDLHQRLKFMLTELEELIK